MSSLSLKIEKPSKVHAELCLSKIFTTFLFAVVLIPKKFQFPLLFFTPCHFLFAFSDLYIYGAIMLFLNCLGRCVVPRLRALQRIFSYPERMMRGRQGHFRETLAGFTPEPTSVRLILNLSRRQSMISDPEITKLW